MWSKTNVKTLGVHHGYEIDDSRIWKDKIDKIKSCIQIWKSRGLTFYGKVLVIKSLILSVISFEIEARGIPLNYKKEINTIIWKFVWDNKIEQVGRAICKLSLDKGGLNMIDTDELLETIEIKTIYRIIHDTDKTWNVIAKYYLKYYDVQYNDPFYVNALI